MMKEVTIYRHIATGKIGEYAGSSCDYFGNIAYAWFTKVGEPSYTTTHFTATPNEIVAIGRRVFRARV